MKRLFIHVMLAVTGMLAYGFAILVGTLYAWAMTGKDSIGVVPMMVGMAAAMGVSAHAIEQGKALPVLGVQVGVAVFAGTLAAFPGLLL